jgi:hypothetical protein
VIFRNPRGTPAPARDECGCRWFDRMVNACYECGAPVTEAMTRSFAEALAEFQAAHPDLAARPPGGGGEDPGRG